MHHDPRPFLKFVSVLVLEIESSVELESLGNGILISASSCFFRIAEMVLNIGCEFSLGPLLVKTFVFNCV